MNRAEVMNGDRNKRFSVCADEVAEQFKLWLCASGITQDEFTKMLNNDLFNINYLEMENGISCELRIANNTVGKPFISQSNKKEDISNFKIDLSLLLIYIASFCDNAIVKKNIMNYVNDFSKIEM